MRIGKLFISSCLVLLLNDGFASERESNGGFAYSKTSGKLLKEAQSNLLEKIGKTPVGFFNDFDNPVDREKLGYLVKTLRFNYTGNMVRHNAQGDKEPLLFNYGVDSETGLAYIEALEPYFQIFAERPANDENISRVMTKILHESAHHFKYDEDKAELFAQRVILQLNGRVGYDKIIGNNDRSYTISYPEYNEPSIFKDGVNFSSESDVNGLCKLFGFRQGVTKLDDGEDYNERLNIGSSGLVAGVDVKPSDDGDQIYRTGLYLLVCREPENKLDPESDYDEAHLSNRAAEVTLKKINGKQVTELFLPYVKGTDYLNQFNEMEFNRIGLVADGANFDGICRYYGYKEHVTGSTQFTAPEKYSALAVITSDGQISKLVRQTKEQEIKAVSSIDCIK